MVICLERGADLHNMAQLMPLPLTVSCFSKIQIGFTFVVPAHPCSPGQRAVKRVCVCVPLYGGSAAEWLAGNSPRQTVHTHRASVHQAEKLVAALLKVAGVTAGLAESNGSQPPGL